MKMMSKKSKHDESISPEIFKNFLEYVEENYKVLWDYSGRGMYGKKCVGVVTGLAILAIFADYLIELDCDDEARNELLSIVSEQDMLSDSYGRDTLYYWPNIYFEDHEDSENG